MKKNIAKLLLCTVCVLSISAPAYAKEIPNQTAEATQISTRAHDMEYYKEEIDSTTEYIDLGEADGQPEEGTCFDSPGGSFYWTEGGSSVDASVTLGGELVSISLTPGEISDRVTQYSQDAPPNRYYKLGVIKKVKVTKYKIYRRLQGSQGAWTFDSYTTECKTLKRKFYLIKC